MALQASRCTSLFRSSGSLPAWMTHALSLGHHAWPAAAPHKQQECTPSSYAPGASTPASTSESSAEPSRPSTSHSISHHALPRALASSCSHQRWPQPDPLNLRAASSLLASPQPSPLQAALPLQGSVWAGMAERRRHNSNLSRRRVPKSYAINDNIMPNTTDLKYGTYGLRAVTGRRVAANTIEAVRRTLVRKIKRTARVWVRMEATVPVTKKPLGIRMGKGKGAIEFYACAVRPGQIVFEMDRVPRKVALSALDAVQPKFPCRLCFVEWS